ncbi:MAG TPA: MerR family transcriptional regulator [Thermoflexales bacterium]|nr:MerR family transcriptional regulator [Thermoflexales bacterium]HQW34762.1 MerR family transcriptional regulator [Thermoflexales bacterium]HQZ23352.1 MerR family transcriptional regulator [Thermoflexales bacterium]
MMKIAEVSEQFGLSSDTLRYYERVGLLPPVNRTKSGIRDYDEFDLKRVDFIRCMRTAGMPVEVLIEYVGLIQQGDDTIEARKDILIKQRDHVVAQMAEMQKTLDLLGYKIEMYEKALVKKEQDMLSPDELMTGDDSRPIWGKGSSEKTGAKKKDIQTW